MKRIYAAALLVLLLAACSDSGQKPPYGGLKIGKPYEVYGRWYKPKYEADYDEIGKASWYGPGFHGGKTANGERFNQNDMTAAHRTLPLPSIVRVTNLDNGRSAIVRVNDRGPFSHDRILDLSKAAATELGVIRTGTARVRVQFLEKETKEYVQNTYGKGVQFANSEMRKVDPVQAGQEQEKKGGLQFVPNGQEPPPDSVPVTGEVLAMYQGTNIFKTVDSEGNSEEGTIQTANEQPAPAATHADYLTTQSSTVHPLRATTALYIQLATFSSKANADGYAERIGDYDAHVMNVPMSGNRMLYRVVMGPYNRAADAKNMLSKLGAAGIPDAKIIRN